MLSALKSKSVFHLIVRTNANETKIVSYDKDRDSFIMDVAAPPQDGKANAEIVRFLSKNLKKNATIMSGLTSKRKMIRTY